MADKFTDDQLMRQALDLAREGIGLASPNPYVGAVITDVQGNIVGRGSFTYDEVKHAEILALQAAGDKARGGTLYINLEPHAHQGRTPPCTDALIAAGIRRVVASMADPNPKVCGRGFEQLRAAGMEVEVGMLEQEARRLNEAFARFIRKGLPLVTLKSAMTLDGKIAALASRRESRKGINESSERWITGEEARAHVHELRHQHDAILVGVGTVLADNPLLTDRTGRARRRPLLRVILDSSLRIPIESRLVQNASAGDVLVFCTSPDETNKNALKQLGVRVESVSADATGRPDLNTVLKRLAEMEILSVMIEGGARVNGAALAQGVADRVFFYYAPTILGSESVPLIADIDDRIERVPETNVARIWPRITNVQHHRFGEDFAVEGYLRDPYAE